MSDQEPGNSGLLLSGLAGEEWLRWVAIDVRGPLTQTIVATDLSPVAATALGRALSGVALLYRHAIRTPRRVELRVVGDGPLGVITAEISSERFRGRVGGPQASNELFGGRRHRLREAVGSGILEVIREGRRGDFRSQVELVTGEIGSDLAHFLLQSEQTTSVLAVGELLSPDGVEAAGGYLVEALPGTPERILAQLEANLEAASDWSSNLAAGGLENAIKGLLDGVDPTTHEREVLIYQCGCSREGILTQLHGLSPEDLRQVAAKSPVIAECEYCARTFEFTDEELLKEASPPRSSKVEPVDSTGSEVDLDLQ